MKKIKPTDSTRYIHAFVFKCGASVMEEIRKHLLECGAALIFEKHGLMKLFIKTEEEVSGNHETANNH